MFVAMAATSSDITVRRLARSRWDLLHTVGGHFVLGTFSCDFSLHAPVKRRQPTRTFGPLTLKVWALRAHSGRLGR
jgi:DMSO/TMAO reductase YedYZ heme-binding membrane subunit